MAERTTQAQRAWFYERFGTGESYAEIAIQAGVSRECVRYWCRRQKRGRGTQTSYRRVKLGLLCRFDAKVRYVLLRLRLEHPGWGVGRIRFVLQQRSSLRGVRLPGIAQMGRYLHQWKLFRRKPNEQLHGKAPKPAQSSHQCWQMDFKLGIVLQNGRLVNLHTVRDPFGAACIGARVYDAGPAGKLPRQVNFEQVRRTLRGCFAAWNTLPQQIQTDNQTGLVAAKRSNDFPTPFTLWLIGLNIQHVCIRPGRPTDNAEVERCHRTLNEYAIRGHEDLAVADLQEALDQSVLLLNFDLPSHAHGCHGCAPIQAHPDLLVPPRPFQPEWELAAFDIQRVYTYLALLSWQRTVSEVGQVYLGAKRYAIGRQNARKHVRISFDPQSCEFVFWDNQIPLRRLPARGLQVSDLTGLGYPADTPGPQQLVLPLPDFKRVSC